MNFIHITISHSNAILYDAQKQEFVLVFYNISNINFGKFNWLQPMLNC